MESYILYLFIGVPCILTVLIMGYYAIEWLSKKYDEYFKEKPLEDKPQKWIKNRGGTLYVDTKDSDYQKSITKKVEELKKSPNFKKIMNDIKLIKENSKTLKKDIKRSNRGWYNYQNRRKRGE